MAQIDDIPVDVWPNIFKNLSINDLFNCRLVNKKFKDFSEFSNSIYRLFVSDYFRKWNYWDHHWKSYKLIDRDDTISFKCFQFIKSLKLFNLNNNLKYLVIENLNRSKLEELSYLNNLEYLNIRTYAVNDDQYLNLINLKHLIIGRCEFKLNLNAPRLEIIRIEFKNNINFQSNPESVKHLIISQFDNRSTIFNNLEILEFECRPFNFDPLSFNKLKQVKFNYYSYYFYHTYMYIFFRIKEINQNIDFYLNGMKIIDGWMINEYVNDIEYKINNYNLLDLNLKDKYLNYDELENSLTDKKNDLPSSFFDKFSNLKNINAKKAKNGDRLNWFLKNLNNKSISIKISDSLSQDFYNNIPNTIIRLRIVKNSNINLNYEFLFEFKRLEWFRTEQNIDLFELALDLFLELKYLEHFAFDFGKKKIRIERNKNYYRLYTGFRTTDKNLNYDDLVKLCDKIRN